MSSETRTGRRRVQASAWGLAVLALLLAGCATMPRHGEPGQLVSRTPLSPTAERLVVDAGGRDIMSLVLLPDGFSAARRYPVVVALHNFAGEALGFTDLIHAERLRARGIVVLAPQAAGLTRDWKGPGITLMARATSPDGSPVDDIAGVARTLKIASGLYGLDPGDVNVVGFSQGATLALALSQRLDAERPGAVRRLFMAAGSLAGPADASLALKGTDLVAYEPGHNWPQVVAEWRTGEPAERVFLPQLLAAKGCTLAAHQTAGRLETRTYTCADGGAVTHIFEAEGEHAWPGQDAKYDSWFTGSGSTSGLDFTDLIANRIAPTPPSR